LIWFECDYPVVEEHPTPDVLSDLLELRKKQELQMRFCGIDDLREVRKGGGLICWREKNSKGIKRKTCRKG